MVYLSFVVFFFLFVFFFCLLRTLTSFEKSLNRNGRLGSQAAKVSILDIRVRSTPAYEDESVFSCPDFINECCIYF